MNDDLVLITNIRVNKNYLGVVFEKNKDYCLNFLRSKNNILTEDELVYIYTHSVATLYNIVKNADFTLNTEIDNKKNTSLRTFLTSICLNKFYNSINEKKKIYQTIEIDNFEYIADQIIEEIQEERDNRLIRPLEIMRNSTGNCYELLFKAIYEGYSNTELNELFNLGGPNPTKTKKNRCKNKLKTIALSLMK